MRSDWTIPLCTGEERLKGRDGKKLHPTQKPESLLARVILASSRLDDLVLDPFCGTGTTGAVGKRSRAASSASSGIAPTPRPRKNASPPPRSGGADDRALRDRARGAAGAVCGADRARPGDAGRHPTDVRKRHKALVRADGAVALRRFVGSIHRIGALAQGFEACNGWTFWHGRPRGLTLIDEFRALCGRRWRKRRSSG